MLIQYRFHINVLSFFLHWYTYCFPVHAIYCVNYFQQIHHYLRYAWLLSHKMRIYMKVPWEISLFYKLMIYDKLNFIKPPVICCFISISHFRFQFFLFLILIFKKLKQKMLAIILLIIILFWNPKILTIVISYQSLTIHIKAKLFILKLFSIEDLHISLH